MSGLVINPYAFASGANESYVGVLSYGVGAAVNTSAQEGWRFTANAGLRVTHLRAITKDSADPTVRLWAVTGTSLLASAAFSGIDSTKVWESELGSPVDLDSGQDYIISIQRGSSGNLIHRETNVSANISFSSYVSFVEGRGIAGTGFPTTTRANETRGLCDIRFTLI